MSSHPTSLFKRMSRLFLYTPSDLWVFIASWFIYFKWDLLISVFKYKNWSNKLFNVDNKSLSAAVNNNHTYNINNIRKLIRINETASRNHLRKMNCLRRCLCQKEMLNNRAIYTQLHIGVKFVEGKLAAHSWLTCNNELINDSQEIINTYTELTQKLDSKIINSLSHT